MNKQLIINRIKSANNLKNDSELADFLGVKKNTISNWKARDTLDWELVLSKCDNLDLNWLIKEEIEEVIIIGKKKNNLVEENDETNQPTLNLVMSMYRDLAVDYGSLKKENEILHKASESSETNTNIEKDS